MVKHNIGNLENRITALNMMIKGYNQLRCPFGKWQAVVIVEKIIQEYTDMIAELKKENN